MAENKSSAIAQPCRPRNASLAHISPSLNRQIAFTSAGLLGLQTAMGEKGGKGCQDPPGQMACFLNTEHAWCAPAPPPPPSFVVKTICFSSRLPNKSVTDKAKRLMECIVVVGFPPGMRLGLRYAAPRPSIEAAKNIWPYMHTVWILPRGVGFEQGTMRRWPVEKSLCYSVRV